MILNLEDYFEFFDRVYRIKLRVTLKSPNGVRSFKSHGFQAKITFKDFRFVLNACNFFKLYMVSRVI